MVRHADSSGYVAAVQLVREMDLTLSYLLPFYPSSSMRIELLLMIAPIHLGGR